MSCARPPDIEHTGSAKGQISGGGQNANGVPSFSPGLRECATLGLLCQRPPTLKGLHPLPAKRIPIQPLSGLDCFGAWISQGSAVAQPWAGGFERRWRSPEIRDEPNNGPATSSSKGIHISSSSQACGGQDPGKAQTQPQYQQTKLALRPRRQGHGRLPPPAQCFTTKLTS
jgi:hypothetical protein